MEKTNSKQENKTLKQMYEEINQKISETEERRKAFVLAADSIEKETFFLNFCQEILRAFLTISYNEYSNRFYFWHDFKTFVPENINREMNEEMSKEYFVQEIQKYLDKYSPEKLKVKNVIYYSSDRQLKVEVSLV